jgi:hypothetical protein
MGRHTGAVIPWGVILIRVNTCFGILSYYNSMAH